MKTTYTKFLLTLLLVYTVFSSLFEKLIEGNAEISRLLNMNDIVISFIILVTFFLQLRKSGDRMKFMRTGWVYLIASIPGIGIFTSFAPYLRLIRLLLIINIVKKNKEDANRALNPAQTLMTVGGLLLLICSTLILYFENVPEGNIKTALDAVYWSVVTVATVGYGDLYPVTAGGKIISIVMIFTGAGIFVSLAGQFVNFISTRHGNRKSTDGSGS